MKGQGKDIRRTISENNDGDHPRDCSGSKCPGELACKKMENNTYICVCPHNSKAPMPDGSCPRYTVPLEPALIPNVLPPSNIPHRNEDNFTSISPETTPFVQHSIIQQTGPNIPLNYLIVGGSVSLFFTVIFIFSLIMRRKFCSVPRNVSLSSPVNLKNSLLLSKRYAPNPQYAACATAGVPLLRKETLKFLELHEIGEGCFGKVYKGEYTTDDPDKVEIVAIKVLKENATKEAEDDFLREVEIMSAFKHPNILSLLGVVPRDGALNPMMVFEYMAHGDLAELLRSQKKKRYGDETTPVLSSDDLLNISLQIARGMSYLAAQRFVHRDLACRNCLVSQGPVVKIADFGMSRDVYTCDYYKMGGSRLLPVRWMSPESVIYGRFTLESDIWSYGVVLWEIYSFGKQPYYGHNNDEVVKLVLDGIMLIPPTDCPTVIYELMKNCWKTEPRDRMKFVHICAKLERAYQQAQIAQFQIECDLRVGSRSQNSDITNERLSSFGKPLPRPPPISILMTGDILDKEGYLMAKEMEPVSYLETLPG